MAIQSYEPNLTNMQEYLQKEQENQGDGPNWWSIPSGMSSVRILPPWDPTGRVALPVYMHPIEFQGKGMKFKKYNWTCNQKTSGKPCQICEGLEKLRSVGIDVSNYEANRRQFYFNAIVMSDPTFNQSKNTGVAPGTFVLMRAPKTFYDWVISQITNPMVGDITNLQNGIDVYVTKEGTGLGTTYSMTLSPNGRTAVPKEYLDKIDALYNLDEIFSTGFDQEQVDEMLQSLNGSANYMQQNIPNVVNQMGQYVPPQQNNIPQYAPVQQTVTAPVIPSYMNQQQAPIPPMQSVPPQHVNVATPVSPTVSQPVAPKSNTPKCYGSYNPSSVNCVTCQYELDCSKATNQ